MNRQYVKDALLGVAVGDALGVPVEFMSREKLREDPVTDMRGYGTHSQPAGTWSDDSAMTFCLAEMLASDNYNLDMLAGRFIQWREYGYWTPHGELFDIGNATSQAIGRMIRGVPPVEAGGDDEDSNGNGSLMRILPLVFYIKDMPVEQRYQHTKEISSLTHKHARSVTACFIYLEIARGLLQGQPFAEAYRSVRESAMAYPTLNEREQKIFHRILSGEIEHEPMEKVSSSGYVVHTLEAAIWCMLHTDNYESAVLMAVNMGSDTDTTGAVTGGLAGLVYGWKEIPAAWRNILVQKVTIEDLITNLQAKIYR